MQLIVRPRLGVAIAGVAAGIVGAAVLTQLMRAVLFAVTPVDAATYAAVSLLLIVVTLAACYATKQDPLIALRTD